MVTDRKLRVVVPVPFYPGERADRAEAGLCQNHLWMLREVEVLRRACSVTVVSSQSAAFLADWRERFDVMYLPCELCYRTAGVAEREGMPFVMRVFVPPPPKDALSDSIWEDILAMLRRARRGIVAANTLPCVDRLVDVGVACIADPLPHVVLPSHVPRAAPPGALFTYLGRLGRESGKCVDDLVRAAREARVPLCVAYVAAADAETTLAQVAELRDLARTLDVDIAVCRATTLAVVDEIIDASRAVVSASTSDTFWMPGIEALARGRDCRIVGNVFTRAAYGEWANADSWQELGAWMAAGEVASPERCVARLREMGAHPTSYLDRVVPLLEGAMRRV